MGFQHLAFALDWQRPPRHMNQTAYWYVNASQYRYDTFTADDLDAGTGVFAGRTVMDLLAQSVRLGWSPSYPTFDRSSLALADEAEAAGMAAPDYVARELKEGRLKFAVEDQEAEENHPRVLSLWRSNLFGSSAKGNEYFLRHLLGTDSAATAHRAGPGQRPDSVRWAETAPEGKLDLLFTIDFRMTSSTILSDVVLPAATWYEKHDLSTTDMHPFVHSFNPAIAPPVADPVRLGGLEDDREAVQRARGRPPRYPQGRRRQAAVARHPGGDGHGARGGQGLAARPRAPRGVRPGPGPDHAGHRGRRARLHRDLRQDDLHRAAAGAGGDADQGRGLRGRARGRHLAPPQRRCARRGR